MLPEEVRRIAERCVPGTGAPAMRRLSSGLVNDSYRVARGGRLYALRVPTGDAAELGIDREWECRVLERAQAAGLAPTVECCEPRHGILVTRWVAGAIWTQAQVRQADAIESVAQLVRRVHALAAPQGARAMNPAAWIALYRDALARHGRSPPERPAGPAPTGQAPTGPARTRMGPTRRLQGGPGACLAALADMPPAAAVLCHSDLHPQNVVLTAQGPVLLDWEYAHVADPLWDLAGWSCNNDLGAEHRRLLLARYLGREPVAVEDLRLERLAWLYDYVCLLWSEVYATLRPDRPGDAVRARAQLLAERLDANLR